VVGIALTRVLVDTRQGTRIGTQDS
jgi:hypothetical protein